MLLLAKKKAKLFLKCKGHPSPGIPCCDLFQLLGFPDTALLSKVSPVKPVFYPEVLKL